MGYMVMGWFNKALNDSLSRHFQEELESLMLFFTEFPYLLPGKPKYVALVLFLNIGDVGSRSRKDHEEPGALSIPSAARAS